MIMQKFNTYNTHCCVCALIIILSNIDQIMSIKKYREMMFQQRKKLYFQKIRLEVLSAIQEQPSERIFSSPTYDGQQEIMQSFAQFRQHRQQPNFAVINEYIRSYSHQLDEEFKKQVIRITFDHFMGNGHALACCVHVLSKCEDKVPYLSQINIQDTVSQLLTANIESSTSKFRNARVLVYLIYNLLQHSENKESFKVITNYYPAMLSSLGYFDIVVLLLLSYASNYRCLLISQDLALSYLSAEIRYDKMDQQAIYRIFQMLQNYISFDDDTKLYVPLIEWIQHRLKQSKFPMDLKIQSINLIITMLHAEFLPQQQFDTIAKLNIFKEIIMQARFGMPQMKKIALDCLNSLIARANPEILNHYVQNHMLLETIVYAHELQLEPEQIFKLLSSVTLLLHSKENCYAKVFRMGLINYLNKYAVYPNVKIARISQMIIQLFNESKTLKRN